MTVEPNPVLPSDVDAEQAVIGACIARPELAPDICVEISEDDFFHKPHPEIFRAISNLLAEDAPITPLTIKVMTGDLMGDGNTHGYLASLAMAAPTGSVSHLCRQVSSLSVRRRAIVACMDAVEHAQSLDVPVLTALHGVMEAAERAADRTTKKHTTSDLVATSLQRIEDAANGKPVPFVPTGLTALDEALGGLQGGDLCIYAGRPGMGKSTLALTTALAAIRSGRPAIIFSLEMTAEQMLHRIGTDIDYSSHSADALHYSWFRNGRVRPAQLERMGLALRTLPDTLEIRDIDGATVHEIAAQARAFSAKYPGQLGLVVIDYLQKVTAGDRYKGSKVNEVTEISGAAKSLAKRLGWPVVCAAQLSRSVESREEKRPTLSDLRESGAIEQDADSVVGLFRPAYYIEKRKPTSVMDHDFPKWENEWLSNKNRLDLLVLKNRHGAEGPMQVFCDMRASAIRDAAP